jgi:hypothetical protein
MVAAGIGTLLNVAEHVHSMTSAAQQQNLLSTDCMPAANCSMFLYQHKLCCLLLLLMLMQQQLLLKVDLAEGEGTACQVDTLLQPCWLGGTTINNIILTRSYNCYGRGLGCPLCTWKVGVILMGLLLCAIGLGGYLNRRLLKRI